MTVVVTNDQVVTLVAAVVGVVGLLVGLVLVLVMNVRARYVLDHSLLEAVGEVCGRDVLKDVVQVYAQYRRRQHT